MKKIESECVSCDLPCMGSGCPNKHVTYYVCDKCGDDVERDELFKWNGEEWCKDCIFEEVESELERAYTGSELDD